MSLLQVDKVSKSFGALKAVDGVSFEVGEGKILGIAGPNGSGKSTLFNLISGIPFHADSGRITFNSKRIERSRPPLIARLGLARTFQRETGFDTLTAYENVLMGSGFAGQNSDADIRAALDLVDIDPSQYRRPASELSVFDRKCLMIASALAMRPQILLLDEPASGLTKPEVERSVDLIRKISQQGTTILLIEHVLPMLMSLSQELLVLDHGKVLIMGDPQTVIKDPHVVEAYLGARGSEK